MKRAFLPSFAGVIFLISLLLGGWPSEALAQGGKQLVLRVAHLSSALGTGPEYLKKAANEVARLTEG
jgi:hypothetical protein